MNLVEFQEKLDRDSELRAAFREDPVATLKKHDIHLPEEAEKELSSSVRGQSASAAGSQVLIGVKIKF